ncbi:MAG: hypothetical protein Q9N68_09780 [Gammaproteobacteria bacterium]|nr:hypothetical protein [Gammaproteobacteria bacterium]
MRNLIFLAILFVLAGSVSATNYGAYPPLPGMAAGMVPQPNSLYPPLAGVAPMMPSASPYPAPATDYPQSAAGNSWLPQAGDYSRSATSMPQNAMGAMPNSLFPLFQQQQMMQSNPPLSAGQSLFNGASSPLQPRANGWPQPKERYSYGAQVEHSLEGLWQGSGGEMIAIKDSRFLYSDKGSQKFSGYLSIGRGRFQASIPSNKTVANYHYWIKDDKLTVKDEAGRVLYFQRVYR